MNVHRDTTITVNHVVAEPLPPVSVQVYTGTAAVGVYLTSAQARELASELVAMADEVDG